MPAKKKVAARKATRPVHVIYVLDETASMYKVRSATISGFNEYIKSLQQDKSKEDCRLTLYTFNTVAIRKRFNDCKIAQVRTLGEEYQPTMNTPLYDAIGHAIQEMEEPTKKGDVIVVVHTDGEENSSREFDRDRIFKLIEEKKKAGWNFLFLGADQDAWTAAIRIGIPQGSTVSYDNSSVGTRGAFTAAANVTVGYLHLNSNERLRSAKVGFASTPTDLRKKKKGA